MRRVPLASISERELLDVRLSCLKVLFGSTIGLTSTDAEWTPDDDPPSASECVGWLWFCRPDLSELFLTAATDDIRELITLYNAGQIDVWFKRVLDRYGRT